MTYESPLGRGEGLISLHRSARASARG